METYSVCELCFSKFKERFELAQVSCYSIAEHNDVRKIPVIKRDGRLHMMEHSSNSTRKPNTVSESLLCIVKVIALTL